MTEKEGGVSVMFMFKKTTFALLALVVFAAVLVLIDQRSEQIDIVIGREAVGETIVENRAETDSADIGEESDDRKDAQNDIFRPENAQKSASDSTENKELESELDKLGELELEVDEFEIEDLNF